MATITATMTAITKMVRGRMEAVLLNSIVGQPNLNSVQHLVEQIADFTSHFGTTKWGGKHGFLPLILSKAKVRLAARDKTLDCKRLANPDILNPKMDDNKKGRNILQIQEDQRVQWKEYTFQEVVDSMAVEAIAAAVDAQYVNDLEEDYVGYKHQTIKMMVTQL